MRVLYFAKGSNEEDPCENTLQRRMSTMTKYRVGQKTSRKVCDILKVSECCREKGTNLHSRAFKYFCL